MINHIDVKKLIDEDIIDHQPDVNLVNQTLLNLVNTGLLNKEDKERYVFKEQVTWEVVYETLLYSERRYLHDIVASHIEKNKASEIASYAARLTYHYHKSENKKKTVFYSAMAGEYAYSLFAIDDALEFYNKSLSVLEDVNNYPLINKCMLLEKKADVIEATGMYPESIALYEEAIEIIDKGNYTRRTLLPWKPELKKQKSILNHKLSVAYERSLQYEKSLLSLDIAENSLPSRSGELPIKISATRSVVYYRKYDFEKAMDMANKSLSLARGRKSQSDISYAYNIIANIYSAMGNEREAIKYYKNALSVCEEINDISGISMCYYNLGASLAFLPDFEKSNYYFFKSIELNQKMQNRFALMQDYFMIGNNKLQTKELDDALAYFDKSISMYSDKMSRADFHGLCLSRIAEAFLYKGELEKAEINMNESIDLLGNVEEMPDALAQAKIVLIELYIKQDKLGEAENLCVSLAKEFSDMKIPDLEIHVMKQQANVFIAKNNLIKAKEILQKAMNLADKIDAQYEKCSIELLNAKVSLLDNKYTDDLQNKIYNLKNSLQEYKIWQDIELADDMLERIKELQ